MPEGSLLRAEPIADVAPETSAPGPARRMAAVVARDPLLVVAATIAAMLALLAVFAPVLAPFDPDAQSLLSRLRPPLGFERADGRYLLGTDQLGRDLLSRCLYGLRLTLILALTGALVGLVIGCLIGIVAGMAGGLVDDLLMGAVDIKLAMPFTLVALLVVAVAGTDIAVLVLVLGFAYFAHFARLVRAQVMSLRDLPYIEAALASGAGPLRIAFRHMLPNIASPVIVMFTLNVSNLVLLESALSFLGLGVQPPTATLGSMVGQGRDYMASAPWIVAAPALLIVFVALAVMLLGDWLRDRFDVRLQDR